MFINRITLRNKIIALSQDVWKQNFECILIPGSALFRREKWENTYCSFDEFVIGTKKGGRSIYIYPHPTRAMVPHNICLFMRQMEELGAIVGIASDFDDAFDIIFDDESKYKRKKRTYDYLDRTKRERQRANRTNKEKTGTTPNTNEDAVVDYR